MALFEGEIVYGNIPSLDAADIKEILCRSCSGFIKYDENYLTPFFREIEQPSVKGVIKKEIVYPIENYEKVYGTIRSEHFSGSTTGEPVNGVISYENPIVGGFIPTPFVEIPQNSVSGTIKSDKLETSFSFPGIGGSIKYPKLDVKYSWDMVPGKIQIDLSRCDGLIFEGCCGYIPDESEQKFYEFGYPVNGVIQSESIGSTGFTKVEYELPVEIGVFTTILKTSSRIIYLKGLSSEQFLSEDGKVLSGIIVQKEPFEVVVRTEDMQEFRIKIIPYYSWKKTLFRKLGGKV